MLLRLSPPAGESINPRVAGLIGRSGPQNKQPFMVAFFKATEVHLRSIRSASGGAKQRNPNRSKGAKSQEALRVANVAGKHAECVFLLLLCAAGADLRSRLEPTPGLIWLLSGHVRNPRNRTQMTGRSGGEFSTFLKRQHIHANTHKRPQIYNISESRQKNAAWPLWFLPDKTCDARSGPLF